MLNEDHVAKLFPFGFSLDAETRFTWLGPGWSARPVAPHVGDRACDYLAVSRPNWPFDFAVLGRHLEELLYLTYLPTGMPVRGHFVPAESEWPLLFIGSPWVTEASQLTAYNLTLSELALHDPLTDFLFAQQTRDTALKEARSLADRLFASEQMAHVARHHAETATELKSKFVAMVSHEIRNPLSVIVGTSDLLALTNLTPNQREYVDALASSSAVMLRLVNDLIDFSKIEAGRVGLVLEPFAPADLIGEVVRGFLPAASREQLRLSVNCDVSVPVALVGDSARLRQILMNFIGNAIKFAPHGDVTIHATAEACGVSEVLLRFEVQDNGPGISATTQATLFQPFERGSARPSSGGAGLGLFISRHLARLMGGDAGVESELGFGSKFWATARLGVAQKADEASKPLLTPDGLAGRPRVVLVVDDSEPNRIVTASMLRSLGCDVDVARGGAEAVEAASAKCYDAIIMDCQMPGMDGFEAARAIRKRGASNRVPILALTGSADEESRHHAVEAGMDVVLLKPLGLATLADVLARLAEPVRTKPLDGLVSVPSGMASVRRLVSSQWPQLCEVFLRETQADLERIRRAIANGDGNALATVTHALCGSAATIGAPVFASLSRALHEAARLPEQGKWRSLVTMLEKEFGRLRQVLSAMPAEPPAVSLPQERTVQARIVLADDHPVVRLGVRHLVEAVPAWEVVGEAADGDEVVGMVERLKPNILLLDLMMPRMPGLASLRLLADTWPQCKVLLLTAKITAREILEALQLGARGVVLKEAVVDVLVLAVAAVLEGNYWLGTEPVVNLTSAVRDLSEKRDAEGPARFGLTPRETQVVKLIVDGLTNRDIATSLRISEDTVKRHLTHVFNKTGASTRLELALFSVHHGIGGSAPVDIGRHLFAPPNIT